MCDWSPQVTLGGRKTAVWGDRGGRAVILKVTVASNENKNISGKAIEMIGVHC